MNELIKVNHENDKQTVLGRSLHEFLNVDTSYTTWFKRMTEYGFTEGTDFIPFSEESTGGRPSENHQMTLDMAKEISMLQRTDKGKEARNYFIQVEQKYKESQKPVCIEDLIIMQAQSLKDVREKVLLIENRLEKSETFIETVKDSIADKPKEEWRKWINHSINSIVKMNGDTYGDLRSVIYLQLEADARCNLAERVRRAKERMGQGGAKKADIKAYCKLSAIEDDTKLKIIFTGIIEKMLIKYAA